MWKRRFLLPLFVMCSSVLLRVVFKHKLLHVTRHCIIITRNSSGDTIPERDVFFYLRRHRTRTTNNKKKKKTVKQSLNSPR